MSYFKLLCIHLFMTNNCYFFVGFFGSLTITRNMKKKEKKYERRTEEITEKHCVKMKISKKKKKCNK